MALYNSMLGLDSQQPQQNQYLTGNPSTDPQANTLWMDQSKTSDNTGINGGGGIGNISTQQSTPPSQVSNGTMLGSIAAGNVGQYMPGGYDQGKWNDPNKHDPKYDVGRILSKYPPGPEGLQAAAGELQQLGYRVVGKDKIQGPAGLIDVGQSFSDPNAQHSWYWSGDLNAPQGGMQQGSMMGMQQGNNPFAQNNMMQQIWQALQARRNSFAGQQFNPTGGNINQMVPGGGITGGIDKSGGYMPNNGNTGVSGQIGMSPQPQSSMIGQQPLPNGTGMNQPQSNGLVWWPGMQMQPGITY